MYGTYFLARLSGLTPLSHGAVIATLKSTRASIEQSSDSWSKLLIWSTAIVAVGVILEIVAEAMEVRKDLKEGKRIEPFHFIAFAAAAVVALFVGVEGLAEFKTASIETALRENNSAEQRELQASADDAKQTADAATSSAVALAGRVGGLDALVAQTNGTLDQLTATATDQKTRSDALIASLTKKQREVNATIEAAQKDENALRGSADTIRDLRQQLHALRADRILTEEQSDDLTRAAKPLRHIEFDVAAALTSEAWNFAKQIATALQAAGWEWKPRPMFPAIGVKGVPDIGNDVREGLILEACKSDVAALDPFAGFVRNQLSTDGFSFTGSWFEDTDAVAKAEPCGRLHIIVGSKY